MPDATPPARAQTPTAALRARLVTDLAAATADPGTPLEPLLHQLLADDGNRRTRRVVAEFLFWTATDITRLLRVPTLLGTPTARTWLATMARHDAEDGPHARRRAAVLGRADVTTLPDWTGLLAHAMTTPAGRADVAACPALLAHPDAERFGLQLLRERGGTARAEGTRFRFASRPDLLAHPAAASWIAEAQRTADPVALTALVHQPGLAAYPAGVALVDWLVHTSRGSEGGPLAAALESPLTWLVKRRDLATTAAFQPFLPPLAGGPAAPAIATLAARLHASVEATTGQPREWAVDDVRAIVAALAANPRPAVQAVTRSALAALTAEGYGPSPAPGATARAGEAFRLVGLNALWAGSVCTPVFGATTAPTSDDYPVAVGSPVARAALQLADAIEADRTTTTGTPTPAQADAWTALRDAFIAAGVADDPDAASAVDDSGRATRLAVALEDGLRDLSGPGLTQCVMRLAAGARPATPARAAATTATTAPAIPPRTV